MRKLYGAFLNEKATPAGKPVAGAAGGKDSGAMKYVKQVHGKWALVSRKSGRPLKYFDEKLSQEQADKALRAVEFFKHESVDLSAKFGTAINKLIEAKDDDRKDGKGGRSLKMSDRFDFLKADKEHARKRREQKAAHKRHDPDED
jgi:hypothetical protein